MPRPASSPHPHTHPGAERNAYAERSHEQRLNLTRKTGAGVDRKKAVSDLIHASYNLNEIALANTEYAVTTRERKVEQLPRSGDSHAFRACVYCE